MRLIAIDLNVGSGIDDFDGRKTHGWMRCRTRRLRGGTKAKSLVSDGVASGKEFAVKAISIVISKWLTQRSVEIIHWHALSWASPLVVGQLRIHYI